MPDLDTWLEGPTAIVVGGDNPSGVAKVVRGFFSDAKKGEVKVGVLANKTYDADQVKQLAELPSLEVLRAQLLGLLSTPAQQFVFVLSGVPRSMLNVLQAKAEA
jgi:large subunit ribosomal protein L10